MNTQPRGLARLDAQGITELRELILDMYDGKVWLLYEQRQNGVVLWKEWQADKERLDFCDELAKRIVARAKGGE